MSSRRFLTAWTLALFFLAPAARGLYAPNAAGRDGDRTPQAVIVKLAPPSDTSAAMRSPAGRLDALATVHQQMGVVDVRPLLPAATRTAATDPLADVFVVTVPSGRTANELAEAYSALGAVEYAEPDYYYDLLDLPDDPLYSHQWSLNNTGQGYYHVMRNDGPLNDSLVIAFGTPGADIDAHEVFAAAPEATATAVVAIIDTGLDTDHPELAGVLWVNPLETAGNGIDDDHNGYTDDINGWNLDGSNDITDDHGHGTHCGGIIAAQAGNAEGIAGITEPCRLMMLKGFPYLTTSKLVEGIVYAVENGADVISMSLGSPWSSSALQSAVSFAQARGVVLVAASGNTGFEIDMYPASFAQVIAVSATDSDDHVTSFSTFNQYIEVCAPGQSVLSLRADSTDMYEEYDEPDVHIIDSMYYLASGTSMACPHVAAAAAWLRALSPGLSPSGFRNILAATVDDLVDPYGQGQSLPGWDKYSGNGRLNLFAAVGAAPDVAVSLTSPAPQAILSGTVPVVGTAEGTGITEYTLEYGAGENPSTWTEITTAPSPVTEAMLGSWDLAGLEGAYTLRLRAGADHFTTRRVWVVDSALALISSPMEGQAAQGMIPVSGTAACPDFSHSLLEFEDAASPGTWQSIAMVTAPVSAGLLGDWDAVALPLGAYRLRLSVYSTSGLEAVDSVNMQIQSVFTTPLGWTFDAGEKLATTANYADLDGDGMYEILVGTESRILYLNPDGTEKTTGVPSLPPGDYRIGAAVGHLDADGKEDFVTVRDDGMIFAYRSGSGVIQFQAEEVPVSWNTYFNGSMGLVPKVFLRDVDNDGIDEIHYHPSILQAQLRTTSSLIYKADGTRYTCSLIAPAYDRCLTADLNGDGADELYCFGINLALLDSCAFPQMTVPVTLEGEPLIRQYAEMSAADIDGDGDVELLLHGFSVISPTFTTNYHLFVYEDGLVLKDGYPRDMGANGRLLPASHPVVGDLDGDGSPEYVSAYNDVTNGTVNAWRMDGTPLIGDSSLGGFFATSSNPSIFFPPILSQVDADDDAEVVLGAGVDVGMLYPIDRVTGYDRTGAILSGYPMVAGSSAALANQHVPMIADVDADGTLDMIYLTTTGQIVSTRLGGAAAGSGRSPSPMWRYGRRLSGQPEPCCQGRRGNVDGAGVAPQEIDSADLGRIVEFLFSPPGSVVFACVAEADVNSSGGATPVDSSDLGLLVSYLFGPPGGTTLPMCTR